MSARNDKCSPCNIRESFLRSVVTLAKDPCSEVACVTAVLTHIMPNECEPIPFCENSRPTACTAPTLGGKRSLLFPYGNRWATFQPTRSAAVGQFDDHTVYSGPCTSDLSQRVEASRGIVAPQSDTPMTNALENGGFRRPARARLANSSQKLSRPDAGSPAEPARQHTRITASRRLQIASRGVATPRRQPPRRVGFGT